MDMQPLASGSKGKHIYTTNNRLDYYYWPLAVRANIYMHGLICTANVVYSSWIIIISYNVLQLQENAVLHKMGPWRDLQKHVQHRYTCFACSARVYQPVSSIGRIASILKLKYVNCMNPCNV